MRRLPDGRFEYTTKRGVTLAMTAEGLVKRLVALVPPARLHLTSGHGVYAANAALRSVVLRQEPVPAQPQEAPAAATRAPPSPSSSPAEQEKPPKACLDSFLGVDAPTLFPP